jgi:ATP-dependent Clp protease protease subunit
MQWIPAIEERSSTGVREISVYSRHLRNRKIFLTGEINEAAAENIISEFMLLADMDSEKPISFYVNSGGGEVQSGLMIYDVIRSLRAPVNIICTGTAASMAAVLLCCGEKGRRCILPHGETMIHEPLLSGSLKGSASSIRHISESILETKDIINTLLAKHTGKTKEEIDLATSFDNYMNAEESVRFGLCDRITGINGEETA